MSFGVWVAQQLGAGDPEVGFLRIMWLTAIFAGVAALLTAGGIGRLAAHVVVERGRKRALFQAADIPRRLMPAAIGLGAFTFTMSALPGTPAVQNAIPMPYFGTTPFAAPGLGIIAAAIMLGFGLWWLRRAETAARRVGEGFGDPAPFAPKPAEDSMLREIATGTGELDPTELRHGRPAADPPDISRATPIAA